MDIESYFIRQIGSGSSAIGDDGAVKGKWVYSKDLFCENVHFKRRWLTPYQIGYKAMLINISDAIAMNADPVHVLVGAALPASMSLEEMRELSCGMRECAHEYGAEIIGGDTIGNSKLDLSITVISDSKNPLMRRGLKIGDWIAHTGELGKSMRQLRYLMAGGKVHSQSRFVRPKLRRDFVRLGRKQLRCGMDISDGLYSDVAKICTINTLGIQWNRRRSKREACSGEEYEMLIGFHPRSLQALKAVSKRTRTPFTIVGKAIRGKFTNRCKAHHF